MRFLLQRATSRGRFPHNQPTYRGFVTTFNRGQWASSSAQVDPAAPGGLAMLTALIVSNAIRVCLERWNTRRAALTWSRFPWSLRTAALGNEARLAVKLLLVASAAAVFSGWIVIALPTRVMAALLVEWMVFACVASLLE